MPDSPAADGAGSRAAAGWQHRAARAVGAAWQRVRRDAWPLTQRAAAATVAWVIAVWIGDHPDPFFAPIAAVVALDTSFGERGLNALRLLTGVVVGIVAGELTLLTVGGGWPGLAVATFAAMVVARARGGAPLVVAQAASAAILTIAVANGQGGPERLVDAAIGAGVALVFSQLLFTPEPVRLLRRAESDALRTMAAGLRRAARVLSRRAGSEPAVSVRDLLEQVVTLGKARAASARVARHSLAWQGRRGTVREEQDAALQLELLGLSCIALIRTALEVEPADDHPVGEAVNEIAGLMTDLAQSPADQAARQAIAGQVPRLVADTTSSFAGSIPLPVDALLAALRQVAIDLMVFAGVVTDEASSAVSDGTASLQIAPAKGRKRSLLARLLRLP